MLQTTGSSCTCVILPSIEYTILYRILSEEPMLIPILRCFFHDPPTSFHLLFLLPRTCYFFSALLMLPSLSNFLLHRTYAFLTTFLFQSSFRLTPTMEYTVLLEVARENIIYFRSHTFTCIFDSQLSRLGPEFWINLYNALIMHANVVVGNAKTPEERGEYNLLPSEILAVGFD